ncbi:MAG: hypothetical protein M3Y35_18020 [Actinomycetota bacterium]|nr:hypothetical protein [Actinomycetota bacterium]
MTTSGPAPTDSFSLVGSSYDDQSPVDDALEDDELDEEGVDEADADSRGPSPKAHPRIAGRDGSRALIRRVAQKAVELSAAEPDQRALLSSLLGCTDDQVDLTVAVMSAGRAAFRPVSDLAAIAEADAMEAGLMAAALGRPRMKAAWSVLEGIGAVSGGMPSADMKAAIALAKGAKGMSAKDNATIEAAVALGRRS